MFISYSWTSAEHGAWVLGLATELRESGIDVILDKWDLKEGHDTHAYMEKMVTDPQVEKVILICDKSYAEKANKRIGGVGTETQIISSEVYGKTDSSKFVAIVREKDSSGLPYLPAYYKTKIYIDLSDESLYAANWERLLRWAYDKPLEEKPPLGKKPAFLDGSPPSATLGTTTHFKRVIDAIKSGKNYADGALDEYLSTFADKFELLRIKGNPIPYDDAVLASMEAFLPSRNEAVDLFLAITRYHDTPTSRAIIHRFFERLIPFLERQPDATSWNDHDFDNYRFIVAELFIYAVAVYLAHERFDAAAHLMQERYYLRSSPDYGKSLMVPFGGIHRYMASLEERNKRLELRRLSLRADLLEGRSKGSPLAFPQVMQADFMLFIRSCLDSSEDSFDWFPETMLYVYHFAGPFEVFARAKSKSYFDRMKIVLGIESKDQLAPLLESFKTGGRDLPRWQHKTFSPASLMAYSDLSTIP